MNTQTILLLISAVVMVLTWFYQRRTNNAGWVDVVWSALLGLLAVAHAISADGSLSARLMTGLMGGLWGARLAWHLARRVAGESEDGRYRAMREYWGEQQQSRLFWFFLAQAVVAWVFGWVFWVTANNQAGFNIWCMAAILIWLISVVGESIADRQLAQFRENPGNKGKTCRNGLWRYSRHPNYFFEWLHWCSYPLLAIGSQYWWLAGLGPIVMLAFLYRITGIPYTEKQALKTRGEDYREYQRTTSAFFPMPPRN